MVLAVVAAGVLVVILTGMRPAYDAFGWLVWGRQVLHGSLNIDGAPSWEVILADEPSSALDDHWRDVTLDLLRAHARLGPSLP